MTCGSHWLCFASRAAQTSTHQLNKNQQFRAAHTHAGEVPSFPRFETFPDHLSSRLFSLFYLPEQ